MQMIDGDHLSPSLLEGQRACESALLQERGQQPSTTSENGSSSEHHQPSSVILRKWLSPSSGHPLGTLLSARATDFASRFVGFRMGLPSECVIRSEIHVFVVFGP